MAVQGHLVFLGNQSSVNKLAKDVINQAVSAVVEKAIPKRLVLTLTAKRSVPVTPLCPKVKPDIAKHTLVLYLVSNRPGGDRWQTI